MEVIAQGEGIVLTGFSWKLLRFYTEYTNHVIGYRYLMIKKKSPEKFATKKMMVNERKGELNDGDRKRDKNVLKFQQ